MLIRTEAPADILVVDQLLKNVFATEAEADLVMALRENGQRTLSLVACDDEGEIVGHVMFSPVTLEGEDLNWQGLAPLAVKEEYRRQGIGAELVKEGLSSLGSLAILLVWCLAIRPTTHVLALKMPRVIRCVVLGMYRRSISSGGAMGA